MTILGLALQWPRQWREVHLRRRRYKANWKLISEYLRWAIDHPHRWEKDNDGRQINQVYGIRLPEGLEDQQYDYMLNFYSNGEITLSKSAGFNRRTISLDSIPFMDWLDITPPAVLKTAMAKAQAQDAPTQG